jgi:hypothetical protein
MAIWYMTRIEFIGNIPDKDRLEAIHRFIQNHIDYDFPFCYFEEKNWRSPNALLQDIMCIFHVLGHMCKGWTVREEDYYGDLWTPKESDWQLSIGTLTEAMRRDVGSACGPIIGELSKFVFPRDRGTEQTCAPLPS